MKLKLFVLSIFLLGGVFFVVPKMYGASYDYYVKEGENGDGSSGDPFGSIKDAAEEVGDKTGKKIFVDKGSYSTSFTLPKETELVGIDAKEVSITGVVTLENKTKLSKIGFTGASGILVTKNAHVTLENIRIKNLSGIGIGVKTDPGSAKVSIRDSLIDGAKKGMYLQAGSTIEATDLEVINSLEEGIDIRENVNGNITKSVFRDNKESGVEIILGSSDFSIRDNTFSGNGASGIAAQFVPANKKLGSVKIEGNSFSKNDWGVDCKSPQGGMDSKFYFLNSLTILNNTFKENRDGEIASRCKIMTDEERVAFEAEEAKKKQAETDRQAALTLSEAALADRLAKAIAEKRAFHEGEAAREMEKIQPVVNTLISLTERLTEQGEARNSRTVAKCFLLGSGGREREGLLVSLEETEHLLIRLTEESNHLHYPVSKELINEQIQETKILLESMRGGLDGPPCSFSLFGWVDRLLAKWTQVDSSVTEEERSLTVLPQGKGGKLLLMGETNYYPKVRDVAAVKGDTTLFGSIREKLRAYDEIGIFLPLPILSDQDPMLAKEAQAPISFPVRFASIFSANNIGLVTVGSSKAYIATKEAYEKTATQITYADMETLALPEQSVKSTHFVGSEKINIVTYVEVRPNTHEAVAVALRESKEHNEKALLVVVWDETKPTLTPERKQKMSQFTNEGANLIVGYGLPSSKVREEFNGVSVYYSLGSPWANFQKSNPSGSEAIGLEISLEPGKHIPTVQEKKLQFTEANGLQFVE